MNGDHELAEVEAALAEAIAKLPAGLRAMLPTNSEGQPQVEIVRPSTGMKVLGRARSDG